MPTREILFYPNPFLRKKAKTVTEFNQKLANLAEDMLETMKTANGIGLAATQIGEDARMFVMQIPNNPKEESEIPEPGDEGTPIVAVNPQILSSSGEISMEEGCLSIPDEREEVIRPEEITVLYQDLNGNRITATLNDLESVCFQHELDHLNGKLFIDRIPMLKREMIKSRIKKANKNSKN